MATTKKWKNLSRNKIACHMWWAILFLDSSLLAMTFFTREWGGWSNTYNFRIKSKTTFTWFQSETKIWKIIHGVVHHRQKRSSLPAAHTHSFFEFWVSHNTWKFYVLDFPKEGELLHTGEAPPNLRWSMHQQALMHTLHRFFTGTTFTI